MRHSQVVMTNSTASCLTDVNHLVFNMPTIFFSWVATTAILLAAHAYVNVWENGKDRLLTFVYAHDAEETYGIPRQLYLIDRSIRTLIAKRHYVSIREEDIKKMHASTVPLENRPGQAGYENLVAQCLIGLFKHFQAEVPDRTVGTWWGTVRGTDRAINYRKGHKYAVELTSLMKASSEFQHALRH